MLITEAQIVIDDEELETEGHEHNHENTDMVVQSPVGQLQVHDDSHGIEVQDPNQVQVTISVDVPEFDSPVPGVNPQAAGEVIMVSDSEDEDEPEEDKQEAKDSKKESLKWNWKDRGATGFVTWVTERFKDVPKHSGKDSAGIERAIAYLNKLDGEISKAMRLDVDGELDSDKVESIRAKIERGVDMLEKALKKITKKKKDRKKKAELDDGEIIKEAKVVGMSGNYVNVPLLISALARMCVNSTVSAGHSMEDNIKKVGDKFKLSDREKFELAFLIQDMGFPVRADRYYLDVMSEPRDKTKDGFDFAANYNA
jgi:hypothetical protein